MERTRCDVADMIAWSLFFQVWWRLKVTCLSAPTLVTPPASALWTIGARFNNISWCNSLFFHRPLCCLCISSLRIPHTWGKCSRVRSSWTSLAGSSLSRLGLPTPKDLPKTASLSLPRECLVYIAHAAFLSAFSLTCMHIHVRAQPWWTKLPTQRLREFGTPPLALKDIN